MDPTQVFGAPKLPLSRRRSSQRRNINGRLGQVGTRDYWLKWQSIGSESGWKKPPASRAPGWTSRHRV